MLKEKINVIVDGVLTKVCDTMMDALKYVHEHAVGHKVIFKCEKVNA